MSLCWVNFWPWQTRCTFWTTRHGSKAWVWVHLFLQLADSRSAHHAEASWVFTFVPSTSTIFNATDAERFYSRAGCDGWIAKVPRPPSSSIHEVPLPIMHKQVYFPKKYFLFFLFLFLFFPLIWCFAGYFSGFYCENHVSIHLIITLLACGLQHTQAIQENFFRNIPS